MFGYIENALVILSRAFLCCLRKLDVAFRKLHISDFFKQDLIVDN